MTAADAPELRQRATNENTKPDIPAVASTNEADTAAAARAPAKPLSVLKCLAPLPFVALHVYYLYTVFLLSQDKYDPFAACSIVVPVVGTVLYLTLVFAGPKLMDALSVPTFDLAEVMFVYNSYQTLLNGFMVSVFVWQVASRGLPVWGVGVDRTPSGHWIAFGIWLHYHDKFIEFLDTVFMVLRRKNSQLTFLHYEHHLAISWAWFAVVANACGGDAYWGAVMNSFIHVVMYSYYALRAVGVSCPWKRQVTNLQLLQFVVCLAHSVYLLMRSDSATIYPPALSFLELAVMVNMIILFSDFYRQKYLEKKESTKAD